MRHRLALDRFPSSLGETSTRVWHRSNDLLGGLVLPLPLGATGSAPTGFALKVGVIKRYEADRTRHLRPQAQAGGAWRVQAFGTFSDASDIATLP